MSAISEAMAEDIQREDENVAKIEAFAKRLRDHKAALGLSNGYYGQILSCTGLSVYCWAEAKSYPRDYMVKRIEKFMRDCPDKEAEDRHIYQGGLDYAALLRLEFPRDC